MAREEEKLLPVYWYYGDEPFLMDREVKRLTELLVSAEYRDFNLNVFYGNECRGEEIAEAAQTLPFFAERRVVVVKRADLLSPPAMEILSDYLKDPSPSTCLLCMGEKVDQRRKVFAELKRQGGLVECKRPYESQLPSFIQGELRRLGKTIDPQGMELLVRLVGNSLQELVSELEKVAAFVGEEKNISGAAVREAVSDTRADSVFELTNALGEKDAPRAMRNLHLLLRDGEAPLQILFMIARHYRQLWKVAQLSAGKLAPQEIASKAGVAPYFLKGVQKQAAKYSAAELGRLFRSMWETDLALKSSRGAPTVLMERLVLEICCGG